MKIINRYVIFLVYLPLIIFLASCAETAENEHLPEYCQSYSGFMDTASRDLYELVEGITRDDYLTAISEIELEFVVDDPAREIDLSGIQCFQNLTSLTLEGQSFKDISPISALKNIQKISLINTSIVSIDSFKNLSKIKELYISGTKTLQSVEGVEEMTKLTILDLSDNGIVNIEGLNNLVNLTDLIISYNEIAEFPNINQLTKLKTLDVSYNNIYVLGDDLSGLSSLTNLNMRENDICDISTLDDLTDLVFLDLSFNNLGCDGSGESPDFSSLENSQDLEEIRLNDNSLVSIEGLRGLDIPLTTLILTNNNLIDITPISDFTNITELDLTNNNIININNLSGMTGLKVINLSENEIVDFSDLLNIPNLEEISLHSNSITSIPDMVTVDDEFWPFLRILDLHSNSLIDTSGVEGHSNLQELIIWDNGLTTLSGISDLPELELLMIEQIIPDLVDGLLPEDFEPEENPNLIDTIINSFNNLPKLQLLFIENEGLPTEEETELFDFGFDLGENVEIYGSISGIPGVGSIDFSGMSISYIDDESVNLPYLYEIDVSFTEVEDIGFILGNPALVSLNISDTPVANLSVISGLTTSDLDELDQVNASNISGDNHLLNAFIELPELSIIRLDGTKIISIENSFNSLVELTTFRLDSVDLISIVDSFNNIFDYYTDENIIQINGSKIGIIDGSFNVGNYEFIEVIDNDSTGITAITDSFNNLTTSESGYISITGNDFATISGSFNDGDYGYLQFVNNESIGVTAISTSFNNITTVDNLDITISGNDYKTVSNSFNTVSTNNLFLLDNAIEVITDSFVDLDVVLELNLQNNRLETLVGLNLVTSVPVLDLANNRLTTVSFIDGITDLNELDISNQVDTGFATLLSLDGINNMPLLDTLIMDDLLLTSIDGLKNISITEFVYNSAINGDIVISSVSSDSFTNTLISNLDLQGHILNNVDFLDNFISLVDLEISVDLLNLSYFETAVFEATLETLTLQNIQDTTDFSSLVEYDELTYFGFISDNTFIINNLDGMASLDMIFFDNEDNLLEFNNSFNDMPDLTFTPLYLDNFTSLTTVDSSFDVYSNAQSIELSGLLEIIDSFNNVDEVTLRSDTETEFNFDTISFDNMETLTIETSNHDSYTMVNGFANLNFLTIENLNKNITDLNNSNIISLVIEDAEILVDTFTLYIYPSGSIEISSGSVGTINITATNRLFNLEIPSGNAILNVDNANIVLTGNVVDLMLDGANIETVELSNYSTNTSTFDTELLNQITRATTNNTNAVTFTINSLESVLDFNMNAGTLNINDVNATNYSLVVDAGDAHLNSNKIALVVSFTGLNLFAQYDLIETFDLTGSLNQVTIDSNNLDSVTLNNASINNASINSDQPIFSVTGTATGNININNDSLNNLTASTLGAVVGINTTNNEVLNVLVNSDDLNITGANIAEVVLDTTSSLNNLSFIDGTSINTLTFNNSDIGSLLLNSGEASLNITGTSILDIELAMPNLNSITANTTSASYNIDSEVVSIDLDVVAQEVYVDSINMTDLNIQSTSIIVDVYSYDSSSLDTITANAANIDSLIISSEVSNMSLSGSNILSSELVNNFIVEATVDVGLNDLDFTSTKTGSATFTINGDEIDLDTLLSTITIDDTSNMTNLILQSDNLANISTGTSTISGLQVNSSSTDLDIIGPNLNSVNVDSVISTLDITAILGADVVVSHNEDSLSSITTNTSDITVNSLGPIEIYSSTLTDSTLNLSSSEATLYLTTPALTYTLDGDVSGVLINSNTLDNLVLVTGFNANELGLVGTNITSLDVSESTISNFGMTGDTTSLSLTADNLLAITLEMQNLNSFTLVNNSSVDDLTIDSSSATLDLNGNLFTTTLNEDSLTSLDLTDFTTSDLDINSTSLISLNTLSSVLGTLSIQTNNNNFDLTTEVSVLQFTSAVTDNLNVTTTLQTGLSINANVDEISLNTPTTSVVIIGENLNSVNGTADGITVSNVGSGILTADVDTSLLTVVNTNYTEIDTIGVRTIDHIIVGGANLTDINTNAVTITNLDVVDSALIINISSDIDNLTLTTNSSFVNFTGVISNNLNLNSMLATSLTLTTNIDSVTLDAPLTDIVLEGSNINNIIGTASSVTYDNAGTGILTADLDANSLTVDNSTFTEINTIGVRTISTVTLGGINLTDINSNAVAITNLNISETAVIINVDSDATTMSVESTSGTLAVFDISNNGQSIISEIEGITVNSLISNNISVSYIGVGTPVLTFSGIGDVDFTADTSSDIDLIGDVVNITVQGELITDVVTTSLTVSNKYKMNNTLIDDLEFISLGLVTSLIELEVDTLASANTESIIDKLRDTSILLVSPITATDIYDVFYDSEFADLTAQEILDSVRYDGYRDTAILDAYNEIRTNEYFNHFVELDLNTIIDDQSYGTMQSYLDSYVASIPTTEAQLIIDNGEAFVQAIRDSIQATLDQTVLTIVELDLTTSVEQSIIDDSNTHATTESGLIGFTIE